MPGVPEKLQTDARLPGPKGIEMARRPGGRPRIEIDHEQLRSLSAEGWSVRRIAKLYGVGKTTVWDRLRTLSENCPKTSRLQSLDERVVWATHHLAPQPKGKRTDGIS